MGLVQKTVYFREEDLPKWEAVRNKAEFLHNALEVKEAYLALTSEEKKNVKKHLADTPIKLQDPIKLDPTMEPHEALDKVVEPLYRDKKKGKL